MVDGVLVRDAFSLECIAPESGLPSTPRHRCTSAATQQPDRARRGTHHGDRHKGKCTLLAHVGWSLGRSWGGAGLWSIGCLIVYGAAFKLPVTFVTQGVVSCRSRNLISFKALSSTWRGATSRRQAESEGKNSLYVHGWEENEGHGLPAKR
ncbi:hypothetical protein O3P69_003623 [Scylla paramamosain]|uniref:Uncharacterized protein n=1 Tax=Scylla paramamosain TaxID=85552 RepID=A0AAW0UJC4_SCYPA